MKLNLTGFVPYGPVGHPDARAFIGHIGNDRQNVAGAIYSYLCKVSAQNHVPTLFFDEDKSLEENGYFVLPFANDELNDELIAFLQRPSIFTRAKPGEPGRKLENMRNHIPGFYQHFDWEIWNAGKKDCDHDFGLETYASVFKEKSTGRILTEAESMRTDVDGDYYVSVTCTRCGAVHALVEQAID